MTIEEKLKMFRDKSAFIADINRVFIDNPKGHSVRKISYEVWHKEFGSSNHSFIEWLIVSYAGGVKSYLMVTGNSNIANFAAISGVLDSGNYEQEFYYCKTKVEQGFKKVNLARLVLTEEE